MESWVGITNSVSEVMWKSIRFFLAVRWYCACGFFVSRVLPYGWKKPYGFSHDFKQAKSQMDAILKHLFLGVSHFGLKFSPSKGLKQIQTSFRVSDKIQICHFHSYIIKVGYPKKRTVNFHPTVFYFPNMRSKFVLTLKAVKILVVLRVASPLIGKKQNSWTRR